MSAQLSTLSDGTEVMHITKPFEDEIFTLKEKQLFEANDGTFMVLSNDGDSVSAVRVDSTAGPDTGKRP